MPASRRQYTSAEEVELLSQVKGACPLCERRLFYRKPGKRSIRGYELAHIYPLNPTDEEREILRAAVPLHSDHNHPDNIIPLCPSCHSQFDKPRTIDEYNVLAELKRTLIERDRQGEIRAAYPLEDEIQSIISSLVGLETANDAAVELTLNPKNVSDKLDDSTPAITRQRLRRDVSAYYPHIKSAFKELERDSPSISDVIYSQVRSFYVRQRTLGLTQPQILENVAEWLRRGGASSAQAAAEVMVAFFVQNCEVLE